MEYPKFYITRSYFLNSGYILLVGTFLLLFSFVGKPRTMKWGYEREVERCWSWRWPPDIWSPWSSLVTVENAGDNEAGELHPPVIQEHQHPGVIAQFRATDRDSWAIGQFGRQGQLGSIEKTLITGTGRKAWASRCPNIKQFGLDERRFNNILLSI